MISAITRFPEREAKSLLDEEGEIKYAGRYDTRIAICSFSSNMNGKLGNILHDMLDFRWGECAEDFALYEWSILEPTILIGHDFYWVCSPV